MSGEFQSGCGTGKTIYWLAKSRGLSLNVTDLALEAFSSPNYSEYVVEGDEEGSTGVYTGDMPAGAPVGTYNAFPYEAINDDHVPVEGDPFAGGGFSFYWNGSEISDDPGESIDTDIALITLNEAKQYLKVTSADDDAVISMLVNSISLWVKGELGRNLVKQTYTEYYDGDGSDELILKNMPIVTLTSVNIDSTRVFGSSTAVTLTDLIQKKESGILQTFNSFLLWACGRANIKVVYDAGYVIADTMPRDIRMAVCRILDHQYRTGYSNRKLDVSTESVGDVNTTYRDGDIPADAVHLIQPYRAYAASPQFSYAD